MSSRVALTVLTAALICLNACDVPHNYRKREFSAPLSLLHDPAKGNPVEVKVLFPVGGLRVHAGKPDSLYHATLDYCEDHTIPAVALTPSTGEPDSTGRLTLSVVARPGAFSGFKGAAGEENQMRLDLAPGVPLILDLNLGEGESMIDLAGLTLRRLRLISGAGDTRVIFARPNEAIADEIFIESTVGDVGVDLLGNANAKRITVTGGVGSIEVDLSGPWRRDAFVELPGSVGDLVLRLPRGRPAPGVRLEVGAPWRDHLNVPGYVRRGNEFLSEGYETAAPRIDVKVWPGIGKMTVEPGEDVEEPSR